MVEAEMVAEAAEPLANGTCGPEDTGEAVIEKEGNENGVKEMEEDSKEHGKAQIMKIDEDHELKEEEGKNGEEKEDNKGVNVEEENDSKESEKVEENKEEKEKSEETMEGKSSRKCGKGRSVGEAKKEVDEKKDKELTTTTIFSVDRPIRERKSVERLVASIEKEPAKEFLIAKGRGTELKDIPNVAYKLSRKKTNETFKMLHMILFGRRGKAFNVKYNISQFSGFVWHENEEKQKQKIKEKFDKCVKEKLLGICDVLDIPVSKAATRKEDIVAKLLDYLVAPHATTDMLLAEKKSSNAKKRKRAVKRSVTKSGGTPAKRSSRKRRKTEDTPKVKEKKITSEMEDESEEVEDEDEENKNGALDRSEDDLDRSEDEVAEPSESEEKEDEPKEVSEVEMGKRKQGLKKSTKKESSVKTKSKKIATPKKETPTKSPKKSVANSSSKHSKADDTSDTSPRVFSMKKKNEETTKKKSLTPSKSATKGKVSKEKSGKKMSKGKDKRKEEESGPTEDELRKVICEILKEVDFYTATVTDIFKQLAWHFDMDLTPRKSAIKLIVQEELTKLANEDDEDCEDDTENEDDPELACQKAET